MIEEFLKIIIKRIFELSEEYDSITYFGNTTEGKVNYIAEKLKKEL